MPLIRSKKFRDRTKKKLVADREGKGREYHGFEGVPELPSRISWLNMMDPKISEGKIKNK